jgi:hypothetical protein
MPPVISRLSEVVFHDLALKVSGDDVGLSTFLTGTRVSVHRMVFDLVNPSIVSVLMEPKLRVPGIWYWGRVPVLAVINHGDGLLPDGTAIELSACKQHMLPEDKFVENMSDVYHPDKRRDNLVLGLLLSELGVDRLVVLETQLGRTVKALRKWCSSVPTLIVPNPNKSVHVAGAYNYADTIESWYVHATAAFSTYDDGCSHIRAWLVRVYLAFATGLLVDFYGVTVSLRKVPKEYRDEHAALVISIVEMVAARFRYSVSVLHQKGPIRNMVTVYFKVVAPPRVVRVGDAVIVDAWDQLYYVKAIDDRMLTLVHPETAEEAFVSCSKIRISGDRVAVLEAEVQEEVDAEVDAEVEAEVDVKKRKVEAVEETVKKQRTTSIKKKYSNGHPGCTYESDYTSNVCRHRKRHESPKSMSASMKARIMKILKETNDMIMILLKRDRNRRRKQRQKQRRKELAALLLSSSDPAQRARSPSVS